MLTDSGSCSLIWCLPLCYDDYIISWFVFGFVLHISFSELCMFEKRAISVQALQTSLGYKCGVTVCAIGLCYKTYINYKQCK